jgi:23S rRNA (cytosine1962-C5)-methyltransferase
MQALLDAIPAMALPTDAQRLFHGRGGLFPGCEHLALDAFPPVLLLTSFKPLDDAALAAVGQALAARFGAALNWVYQCRGEGAQTRIMAVPEPHIVTEAGTRYLVHLLRGQNHGLFLDMAEGRRWVREHVRPGAKVLNLFAYSCAFSVVALQAGASEVVNVDMASGALATGRTNHELNGVKAGAKFLAHDIFNSWGKLTRGGPYDLVICDPPSFQKGSFVATKDYARLAKRLPALLAPGGQALLCLNAPELDEAFLRDAVAQQAPELACVGRLPNPAAFADISADRALKVLAFARPAV